MKRLAFLSLFCCWYSTANCQTYFPPLSGNIWDTISPSELGWCEDSIQVLYDYLESSDSKAFIVLKNGKIVLEKYFGTFTKDSLWVWNSAGKTLTAYAVGIAQTEGLLNINDPTSAYLGTAWTSLTPTQEGAITIRHQLTMTTGLDEGVSFDCTDPNCLEYLAAPGTRWSYHNSPYTLLDGVIENASGLTLNQYVQQKIGSKIGMTGMFYSFGYNNVYVSKARSMARFGLLLSQDGVWNGTTVQSDINYLNEMHSPSQTLNNSYGYLTWLNGQSSFMLPSTQFVFSGSAVPNAPSDMYAALGKNGQIINVVPSQDLVIVRMGSSMGASYVGNEYNDTIWQHINKLSCPVGISEYSPENWSIETNPTSDFITINGLNTTDKMEVYSPSGQKIELYRNGNELRVTLLPRGMYFVRLERNGLKRTFKILLH
jgi:CubicO group peptidase (beta-lactamase class C family)